MKDVVVEGRGYWISKKGELLQVRTDSAKQSFPFARVRSLFLLNQKGGFSAGAVNELSNRGIPMVVCDPTGRPRTVIRSLDSGHHSKLRIRQLDASRSSEGVRISAEVVSAKLRNQASNIMYFRKSRVSQTSLAQDMKRNASKIRAYARQARSISGRRPEGIRPRLMQLEAAGAQLYWSVLRGLLPDPAIFPRREKRGAEYPANAALNYGYAILYARLHAWIVASGLAPEIGFLHSSGQGRLPFLYDAMDLCRTAVVDRCLFGWMNRRGRPRTLDGRLTGDTRRKIAVRVLGRLRSRSRYYGNSTENEAIIRSELRRLALAIENSTVYKAHIWEW